MEQKFINLNIMMKGLFDDSPKEWWKATKDASDSVSTAKTILSAYYPNHSAADALELVKIITANYTYYENRGE